MNDDSSTQADATIRAIEELSKRTQNQEELEQEIEDFREGVREDLEELRETVEELRDMNQDLVRRMVAYQEEERSEIEPENLEESELRSEDEVEEEQEEGPFFKNINPANVSYPVRKNAIVEYFKEVKEEEGKFETKDVYDVLEDVFATSAGSSADDSYKAVYNVLNREKEIKTVDQSGQKQQEFKLNNKVKVH